MVNTKQTVEETEKNTVEKFEISNMESLIKNSGSKLVPFTPGSVIQGTVISSSATRIWVDIQGLTVGVIPQKELSVLSGELKPGDPIIASVLVLEDDRGNMILSLRKADRERILNELKDRLADGQPMQVRVSDANKGGLLVELGDFTGFLPVSQLASEHYPRVDGGNPDEIFVRLKDLIGKPLSVKVINFDQSQGKLIFSEKAAGDILQEEKLSNIKDGDILEGTITGIVDFGLFVKLGDEEDSLEGLVHISEIAWGRVTDISAHYKVGESVKVIVVSTSENRVSLSIKRLLPDPWQEVAGKYIIGDMVKGVVTRVTPFGVFVRIDTDIDGLVHISEISNERITDPGSILHLGETFEFKIISIDPNQHRLGLSFKKSPENEPAQDEEKPKKRLAKRKLIEETDENSDKETAKTENISPAKKITKSEKNKEEATKNLHTETQGAEKKETKQEKGKSKKTEKE